jgi:hypothetical protein
VDGAKLTHGGGIGRISEYCCSRYLRRDLFEQLQPFDAHAKFGSGKAGGVAARARQASDDARADCIGDHYEHGRHGARGLLHGQDARCGGRQDDIRRERDYFHCVSAKAISITRGPSHVDVDIAANCPARLL